jgi:endoglucanase
MTGARGRWSTAALVAVVLVVAAFLVLVLRRPIPATFSASPPGAARGQLAARGPLVVDGDGTPVYLHGVDWPSLDWAPAGQHADGAPGLDLAEVHTMAERFRTNAVRIALNEAFLLRGSPRYVPTYAGLVVRAVRAARRAGLVVILDLHTVIGADAVTDPPAEGPSCAPDPPSIAFWTALARRFRNWPGVVFELYNEPHGITWSTWRDGGPITCPATGRRYDAVGEQTLLEAVRATGARNLVIADGVDWAGSLVGLPRWHLAGSNVAYGLHLYVEEERPTGVATWQGALGSTWRRWPVIATEFGVLGCHRPYPLALERRIIDFLAAHGIGWTAWGWWDGGCGFPSLIDTESGQPFDGGRAVRAASVALARGSLRPPLP